MYGEIFPQSTNTTTLICKSRKENPQKLTQLSSRSHPRHLVGKKTAQKDTIIDIKDTLRLTACLVVNPIKVNSFAYLFHCMTVGRASD